MAGSALSLYRKVDHDIPEGISPYLVIRKQFQSQSEWNELLSSLRTSATLYVGNLSFFTSEQQIYELFGRVGSIKRVIMGLNSLTKMPCGFCFVEYYSHEDAAAAKMHLNGTKLDDRIVRIDIDPGFKEGRQYGKSKITGGQIRDDVRVDFDAGRGGLGGGAKNQAFMMQAHAQAMQQYQLQAHMGPANAHAAAHGGGVLANQQQQQQQLQEQQQPHGGAGNSEMQGDTSAVHRQNNEDNAGDADDGDGDGDGDADAAQRVKRARMQSEGSSQSH